MEKENILNYLMKVKSQNTLPTYQREKIQIFFNQMTYFIKIIKKLTTLKFTYKKLIKITDLA